MIQIEDLNESHIPAIVEIEKHSRPSPWSKAQFQSELTNPNSFSKIARNQEELIGYVIPWHIADEIQIQNIVVAPHHRGNGIGELLLNLALSNGIENQCRTAILEVRESNLPAIGLYQKYKFEIVGKRSAYYRDGENALLMTLPQIDSEEELRTYQTLIQKQLQKIRKKLKITL